MFKECSREELVAIKELVRVAELAKLMCLRLAQLEPPDTHNRYLSISEQIDGALNKLGGKNCES